MLNIVAGDPIVSKDRSRIIARFRRGLSFKHGNRITFAVVPDLASPVPHNMHEAHDLGRAIEIALDYEAGPIRVWRILAGEDLVTPRHSEFMEPEAEVGPTPAGIAKAAEILLTLRVFQTPPYSDVLEMTQRMYSQRGRQAL